MAIQFDLKLQLGPQVTSGMLIHVAQLAEIYAGGYLMLGVSLVIPSIPEAALPEIEAKLRAAGLRYTTSPSEVFADGAGI